MKVINLLDEPETASDTMVHTMMNESEHLRQLEWNVVKAVVLRDRVAKFLRENHDEPMIYEAVSGYVYFCTEFNYYDIGNIDKEFWSVYCGNFANEDEAEEFAKEDNKHMIERDLTTGEPLIDGETIYTYKSFRASTSKRIFLYRF